MENDYAIKFGKFADKDLRELISYIASKLKNPIAADNVRNKIMVAVKSLSFIPERNRIIMLSGGKDVRRALADSY